MADKQKYGVYNHGGKGLHAYFRRYAERYFKENIKPAEQAHQKALANARVTRETEQLKARQEWWRQSCEELKDESEDNRVERDIAERWAELQSDWERRKADLEKEIREEREEFREWRDSLRKTGGSKEAKKALHEQMKIAWVQERGRVFAPIEESYIRARSEADAALLDAQKDLDARIHKLCSDEWQKDELLLQRCYVETLTSKKVLLPGETDEDHNFLVQRAQEDLARMEAGKLVEDKPHRPEKPFKAVPGMHSEAMNNPAIRKSFREAVEKNSKPVKPE